MIVRISPYLLLPTLRTDSRIDLQISVSVSTLIIIRVTVSTLIRVTSYLLVCAV